MTYSSSSHGDGRWTLAGATFQCCGQVDLRTTTAAAPLSDEKSKKGMVPNFVSSTEDLKVGVIKEA